MSAMQSTRLLSVLALAGSVCLLSGCGMDPPPADGSAAEATATKVEKPAGLALVQRQEFTAASANGTGVRCNIETLGGQTLEAVHPTIAAGTSVSLQGWYAAGGTPAPDAAAPASAEAAVAVAEVPAPKAMLVIASENSVAHWTVELPDLRERRDVAKAFDDPKLSKSGFDAEIDLSGLRPGFYSMHLSDVSHSPESVCGLGRGFVIK